MKLRKFPNLDDVFHVLLGRRRLRGDHQAEKVALALVRERLITLIFFFKKKRNEKFLIPIMVFLPIMRLPFMIMASLILHVGTFFK